jgi:hypothetical protein
MSQGLAIVGYGKMGKLIERHGIWLRSARKVFRR